jgi:hypothetical protein
VSERVPIGNALDNGGLQITLREGELFDGATVIYRVLEADGDKRVGIAWTDGMDWITRRALIEIARDAERIEPDAFGEDED